MDTHWFYQAGKCLLYLVANQGGSGFAKNSDRSVNPRPKVMSWYLNDCTKFERPFAIYCLLNFLFHDISLRDLVMWIACYNQNNRMTFLITITEFLNTFLEIASLERPKWHNLLLEIVLPSPKLSLPPIAFIESYLMINTGPVRLENSDLDLVVH